MARNKKLKKLADSIDFIDGKIIKLLELRMQLTKKAALLKWQLGKQVTKEYYYYNLIDKATCLSRDGSLLEFNEAFLHFINYSAKKYERRLIRAAQNEYLKRQREKKSIFRHIRFSLSRENKLPK